MFLCFVFFFLFLNRARIRFVRQNEYLNWSPSSSKFEIKPATCFEQIVNKYSDITTATLQSSHQMNIRCDCKLSRLSEAFGIGIFIAIVSRLHHLIDPKIMD